MASGEARGLRRDLGLIAGSEGITGLGDAELLKRFAGRRGDAAEAAFETIVAKHGPMVLGVCRGVLHQRADADDAFQATFLVLVRKAGSVRVADSLGPWLYGVARRVATRARSDAARRRSRETSVHDADPAVSGDPTGVLDARPILFEELDRLPEKYRSPVVLCHLEGLSHEEAARRLDWPVGTLSGRLSRARALLRSRLSHRGLGVGTALDVPALLPPGAVPPELLRSTVQAAATFAAGGPVSQSIVSLSQGVLTAMLIQKLKSALIAGSAFTMLAVAAGYASGQIGGVNNAPPAPPPRENAVSAVPPRENVVSPVPTAPPQADPNSNPFAVNPASVPAGLTIPMVANDAIVAVAPKDGRSVSAMAVEIGTWQEYRAPKGVSLRPVLANNVLAVATLGDDVRELAAFAGTWVRQTLRRPAKGPLVPIALSDMVYYQVGSDLYAFSAMTNSWDALHLDGAGQPKITWGRTTLLVEQDETLHVFSVSRGKWSVGLKVPGAAAK